MGNKAILYLMLLAIGYVFTLTEPFWGMVTYLSMNYIRPEVLSYNAFRHWRLPENTMIFIMIVCYLRAKYSRLLSILFTPTIFFLLIMTFFMWLSGFNALRPDISLKWTGEAFKMIIVTIFFILLTDTPKKLNYLLITHLAGGGFLALWAFQQHFLGNLRLERVGGGTTDTSNDIAALFVLIFPLFLYLLSHKNKIIKFGSMLGSLFVLADIIFTQSRSAFVGLIMILPYILIRYKSRKKYILALIAIPIMFYAATTTSLNEQSYVDRIDNMMVHGMDVDQSAATRKVLWSVAWKIFKANPWLGVGQQNYQYNQGSYGGSQRPRDAHNSYMLILSEGGFLTTFCYLVTQLLFFLQMFQLRRFAIKNNNLSLQNLVTALESGMIAFLVCGLAHSYIVFEYYYYWLGFPLILKNVNTQPAIESLPVNEQLNGLQVD